MILGTRRVPTLPSTHLGKQSCPCTPVCSGCKSRAECSGDRKRNEHVDVGEPVNAGFHLRHFPQPPSTPRLRKKQRMLTAGRPTPKTSRRFPYLTLMPTLCGASF